MDEAPRDAPASFDLDAAWLRKAEGDHRAFMEGLATRLAEALPGRVAVQRQGLGLLGRRRVIGITATFDTCAFVLSLDGTRLRARRARIVRGVTLGSEPMTVPAWMAALAHDVGQLAGHAERARASLHDFLMS